MSFKVGQLVYIAQSPYGLSDGYVEPANVEKVGKRDLVLSNNTRWDLDGRAKAKDRSSWGPSPGVYQPDDPRLEAVRDAVATRQREHKLARRKENVWTVVGGLDDDELALVEKLLVDIDRARREPCL